MKEEAPEDASGPARKKSPKNKKKIKSNNKKKVQKKEVKESEPDLSPNKPAGSEKKCEVDGETKSPTIVNDKKEVHGTVSKKKKKNKQDSKSKSKRQLEIGTKEGAVTAETKKQKISEEATVPYNKGLQSKENQEIEETKKKPRASGAPLSKKDSKRKLMIINKKIKEYAQGKQLGMALKEYRHLQNLGLKPTIHTYTNMINACVRCGEVVRAMNLLKAAEADETTEPNEVTYTALVKGLVQDGRMGQARWILNRMKEKSLNPNVRTYDTILRGCVRFGDLPMAKWAFAQMMAAKLSPSASSYEYLVKTLCQNLNLDMAWSVVNQMETNGLLSHPSVFGYLARACALTGDIENTNKAIQIAEVMFEQQEGTRPKVQPVHAFVAHTYLPSVYHRVTDGLVSVVTWT